MGHNKLLVRFRELMRRAIRILDYESNRDREYSFARRNIVGKGAKVLDIGGCESLLPLFLAKQGFQVVVYDFRKYSEHHPNLTSIQGDFLQNNLPENAFDYVVMISTIEHIGFESYGAPVYEDADFRVMSEVKRVLRPNGKIVITFPFTSKHKIIPRFQRLYDIDRVRRLFSSLHILAEEYYIPNRRLFKKWINFAPASLEEIQHVKEKIGSHGCACYVVSPTPRIHFQQNE